MEYVNCTMRIPVEQQRQLVALAEARDVRLAEILRDAIRAYLTGLPPGDSFIGPEAGYLSGRAMAIQAIYHHMATSIPTDPDDFAAWVSRQAAERLQNNPRR